jgi:hypothetical protein
MSFEFIDFESKEGCLMLDREVSPQPDRRRVPRLILHFPVKIEVVTRDGEPRTIEARTTDVSRYGATLECSERISVEVAVNLMLPFGGPYMAQVNGIWLEEETGDYRLSIKLLDPPEWTAPSIAFGQTQSRDESTQITLEQRTYYLLTAYQTYLQETRKQEQTIEQITHLLLKKAVRFDHQFQKWMTQKIMEDLQSLEGKSVSSLAPA